MDGLARGFLFAILGLGITLIFGLGEILNLFHGVLAVLAALIFLEVNGMVGNLVVATIIGILGVMMFSLVVDQTAFVPVYRAEGEQRIILGIFVTLGLAIFFQGMLNLGYPETFSLPLGGDSILIFGASIRISSLVAIAISAVALGTVYLFLKITYLGRAMRTLFQSEVGALLCGIRVRRLRTIVFLISSALAGLVGILYGFMFTVSVTDSFELTIFAIIVSIVGGVRNINGTVFAGILLGLVITFSTFVFGSYIATVVLYLVAIGVLLVNPDQTT